MTIAEPVPLVPTGSDPRIVDLLCRVKGVFAAKGFDGASMQDLARAAGISAGNFYRYFPSKGAIIEAMVESDLAQIEADFAMIMRSPDPQAALRFAICQHIEDGDQDGALWAEIEAAALRKAEIGAISGRFQAAVIGHLILVFARMSGKAPSDATECYAAHAELIVLLIKGTVIDGCGRMQSAVHVPNPALRSLVLRQIDTILSEISGAAPVQPSGGQ